MMKKILCMLLCLAMTASMLTMVATATTTSVLECNTPIVNDTYEDGATQALSWTTAHKSSGVVEGTGYNGQQAYNDPGSKYMNFFSNSVTQENLDKNWDKNINYVSGLKSYMTEDINYISFNISSAWSTRDLAVFLDSAGEKNTNNLPVLLFRSAGKYYAGIHSNLRPWYYQYTKSFLNKDYSSNLGSVSLSYSEKEWYNVKFVVKNTSDSDNVSIYVNDYLLNTVSYADSENFDSLIIKDYTVTPKLIAGFAVDDVKVGAVSEILVPDVETSDFVLTNSENIDGTTVTGVKEAKEFDETKYKYVRRFNFDAKSYGESTKGSTDVRASLDGFKKFMTDPDVNTISFDYKITGASDSHIGLFLAKNVNDYGGVLNTGIVLNNAQGILLCTKANWNQGYSDWYGRAKYESAQQAFPNNREWNRLTLEVNNQNGEVTAYINGEKFTVCSSTAANANPPINMDSICFQTAGEVATDGELAILLDNIVAYPGEAKSEDLKVVAEDKIKIIDLKGNTLTDFNEITPGIDKIEIAVNTVMDEEALENGIVLKKADGTEIEALRDAREVESGKYVLDITELLEENSTYTLFMADPVFNKKSTVFDEYYEVIITTGMGEYDVEIEGLYIGETKIKNPDFLTPEAKITTKINYINTTSENETITCIIGYYSADGRLISSEIANTISAVKAPEQKEETVEFTLPEDVSDISGVKVFAWESVFEAKPVSNTYFIFDANWKASGSLADSSVLNLVTTFCDNGGRGFAWATEEEHTDMVIRYAKADEEWYEESVIEDAVCTEYEGRLYYKADIENLEPGETYVYKIGDTQDDVWSDFYTFTMEPENVTEFSFIGLTDAQSSKWSGGFEYYKQTLDKAFAEDSEAAFMVNLGDMVELGYEQVQWDSYFTAVKGYAESIPHMAVMGNHETRGDKVTAGKHFSLQFNNPDNGADALGSLTVDDVNDKYTKGIINNIEETVYSFDYGDVHFAVLNSGTDHSENSKIKIMTEQAKWLDEDLEASDKKWKIVMVHMSMYPAKIERYDTRTELTEIIDKHGVDLVLSGHDHMVARTYPMKNGEIVTTSNPALITKGTGMVNAILGSAGLKRYAEITEKPNYLAFLKATEKAQPTYSLFDVNSERISVVTKQLDGTVVDSFEIIDAN